MTTTPRCFLKALSLHHTQLTPPPPRWLRPIRAPLTPARYNGSARAFTASRPSMANSSIESSESPAPILFSANQPADLASRVTPLLLDKWALTESRRGLKRNYVFKTFNSAWQFMDAVAQQCKVQRHHPEWSNLYNRVTVEWTTHRPEGLSVKDVDMAEFCDRVAAEIGLKEP